MTTTEKNNILISKYIKQISFAHFIGCASAIVGYVIFAVKFDSLSISIALAISVSKSFILYEAWSSQFWETENRKNFSEKFLIFWSVLGGILDGVLTSVFHYFRSDVCIQLSNITGRNQIIFFVLLFIFSVFVPTALVLIAMVVATAKAVSD